MHDVNADSPLAGRVLPGDVVLALDGEDCSRMDIKALVALVTSRKEAPERVFKLRREEQEDADAGAAGADAGATDAAAPPAKPAKPSSPAVVGWRVVGDALAAAGAEPASPARDAAVSPSSSASNMTPRPGASSARRVSTTPSAAGARAALAFAGRELAIVAPPGKLRIHFSDRDGAARARVASVAADSPLAGELRKGDLIDAIDGEDTRALGMHELVRALARKAGQPRRELAVRRPARTDAGVDGEEEESDGDV